MFVNFDSVIVFNAVKKQIYFNDFDTGYQDFLKSQTISETKTWDLQSSILLLLKNILSMLFIKSITGCWNSHFICFVDWKFSMHV